MKQNESNFCTSVSVSQLSQLKEEEQFLLHKKSGKSLKCISERNSSNRLKNRFEHISVTMFVGEVCNFTFSLHRGWFSKKVDRFWPVSYCFLRDPIGNETFDDGNNRKGIINQAHFIFFQPCQIMFFHAQKICALLIN